METRVNDAETKKLRKHLLIRAVIIFIILPVILLFPAVSIQYWQAWAYLGSLFIPSLITLIYLWKHDPALLMRRARTREKEKSQRLIIRLVKYIFLVGIIIPSLDFRYHWSNVPVVVVIAADFLVFAGYMLIFLVFKENTYASRTVEIDEGQKVIATGPYAVVRHPMYSALVLFYLSTPLALGSFWALIPFALLPPLFIFRLLLEEKTLQRDLPGYSEYCQNTRYRLLPFIW